MEENTQIKITTNHADVQTFDFFRYLLKQHLNILLLFDVTQK